MCRVVCTILAVSCNCSTYAMTADVLYEYCIYVHAEWVVDQIRIFRIVYGEKIVFRPELYRRPRYATLTKYWLLIGSWFFCSLWLQFNFAVVSVLHNLVHSRIGTERERNWISVQPLMQADSYVLVVGSGMTGRAAEYALNGWRKMYWIINEIRWNTIRRCKLPKMLFCSVEFHSITEIARALERCMIVDWVKRSFRWNILFVSHGISIEKCANCFVLNTNMISQIWHRLVLHCCTLYAIASWQNKRNRNSFCRRQNQTETDESARVVWVCALYGANRNVSLMPSDNSWAPAPQSHRIAHIFWSNNTINTNGKHTIPNTLQIDFEKCFSLLKSKNIARLCNAVFGLGLPFNPST